jgi:hypothetical protein
MIKNGRILQHKNNKTIDFIVNVVRTEKNTMLDFLWEALPLSQNFGDDVFLLLSFSLHKIQQTNQPTNAQQQTQK